MHYQLVTESGVVPDGERKWIRRTQLLGHIGAAFPQRSGALEQRTIQIKAARKKREDTDEPAGLNIGRVEAGVGDAVSDLDLTRQAAALLIGPANLEPELIKQYQFFEQSILDKMLTSLTAHADSGQWQAAYREMNKRLSRIRKTAGDSERIQLQLLQAACDVALMHMYQYAAGAVFKNEELGKKLGDTSLNFNRTVHCVQDRLGGIVPAIHPLWPICLKTPNIVKILLDYVKSLSSGQSSSQINAVNLALTKVISAYIGLMDSFVPDNIASLDAPLKDGGSQHDTTADSVQLEQAAQSGVRECIREILDKSQDDRDIQVALEIFFDGLDVKTAAEKHSCSNGQISKMKDRGLVKIRAALRKQGLTKEDIFGPLSERRSSQHVKDEYEPYSPPTEPRAGSPFS